MTDKDIIRIEGCIKGEKVLCLSCPYRDQYPDCRRYVIRDIFDVAKRQKAEIERLQTENRILSQKRMNLFERLDFIHKTKTEAVKEFAERLCDGRVSNDPVVIAVKVELKEMVGAESG